MREFPFLILVQRDYKEAKFLNVTSVVLDNLFWVILWCIYEVRWLDSERIWSEGYLCLAVVVSNRTIVIWTCIGAARITTVSYGMWGVICIWWNKESIHSFNQWCLLIGQNSSIPCHVIAYRCACQLASELEWLTSCLIFVVELVQAKAVVQSSDNWVASVD